MWIVNYSKKEEKKTKHLEEKAKNLQKAEKQHHQ